MTLFIDASNPLYLRILQNGPYVPMETIPESTSTEGVRVAARTVAKDVSRYTDADKELIRLDKTLQLIIVEATDNDMSHQIMGYNSAKEMWDVIELLMEGTEEVKDNRKDILTSSYEAFMCQPGETLSSLFERFTKLLSELKLHGKSYPRRETNRKFMLTLPYSLEYKNTSIRERIDFVSMPLDVIYGKLKTYELEQEQRAIIYGPGTIGSKSTALAKTTALVAREPETSDLPESNSKSEKKIVIAEIEDNDHDADESEFYTLEELNQLEDESMTYMASRFKHVRFRKNNNYKSKPLAGKFQKGSYPSGSGSRGGYKSNWVDRSKTRCYNCNELGHFATDCRKPKQAKDRKESYEKRESYEDLKKQNEKLKQKMNAMVAKQKGRAYIAEGKNWDDTDSEDEEEFVNLALMADSTEESTEQPQVPTLTTINMTNAEYKSTVHDLSVELFNVHTSMIAYQTENANLVKKVNKLENENEKLGLLVASLNDTLKKNEYLENKVKCNAEIEEILRSQIAELELKLNAFKKSAQTTQNIIDSQRISSKAAI